MNILFFFRMSDQNIRGLRVSFSGNKVRRTSRKTLSPTRKSERIAFASVDYLIVASYYLRLGKQVDFTKKSMAF